MFNLFGRNQRGSGAIETRRIGIRGITDKSCERTIKKALLTKSGVREVYINRQEGVATVLYDPAQTSVPDLNDVLLRKGYFPEAPPEEKAG